MNIQNKRNRSREDPPSSPGELAGNCLLTAHVRSQGVMMRSKDSPVPFVSISDPSAKKINICESTDM